MKVKNKNIYMLICMIFACCVLALAGGSKVCALEGEGTEASPYQISNFGDLEEFANKVNDENNPELTAYAELSESWRDDMEFTGYNRTPIGKDEDHAYKGKFNGNGHTIKGLKFTDGNNKGLFGYVGSEGVVENVQVEGFTCTANKISNVGAVVGSNSGTVTGCENTGAITCTADSINNVGAVVGSNSGTVTGCTNTRDITCTADSINNVGAVVGSNSGTVTGCTNTGAITCDFNYINNVGAVVGSNSGTVTGCTNTGAITCTTGDGGNINIIGGVVGDNEGIVTGCTNTGAITCTAGDWENITSIGGVAGWNRGTVTSCYNTGAVGGGTQVGGVAGWNRGTVTSCYNTGSVSGGTQVGGVVGLNANYDGAVINCCYSTGTVKGTGDSVGGVIGDNASKATASYCYYDSEKSPDMSAIGTESGSASEVGDLSTAQMTGLEAIGLDHMNFTYGDSEYNPWLVKKNDDYYNYYPHLKGFNFDKQEPPQQLPANKIAASEWPPRILAKDPDAQPCEVTITQPESGATIVVHRGADADGEADQDNIYAEVVSGQQVLKGTLLTIRAQAKPGYKVDNIQYKMGADTDFHDLEDDTLTCTGSVNITAVASLQTYKLELVSDPNSVGDHFTPALAERTSIAYNTPVTITAEETVGTYKFIGWYDGTKLLTEETEYKFTMTSNVKYVAKYASNANKKVIYLSDENEYHVAEVSIEGTTYSWEPPAASPTPMSGYTFDGWDKNDDAIKNELATNAVVIVRAEFKPETTTSYTVTVYIDGDTSAAVPEPTWHNAFWITVKAPNVEGKTFSCWTDYETGEVYGYEPELILKIDANTSLNAVYTTASASFAVIKSVHYDPVLRSLSVVADIDPNGQDISQAGILADKDETKLSLECATYEKSSTDATGKNIPVTCTWVLNQLDLSATLYVRGYMECDTAISYGDVCKVVVGSDYDSVEKVVAIIKSAECDISGKATFKAYIAVPAGCDEIVKAGVVVATPNDKFDPEKDELTCDNAMYVKESLPAVGQPKPLSYTWHKKNATGSIWYVRAFVIYKDGQKIQHEYYGAMSILDLSQ